MSAQTRPTETQPTRTARTLVSTGRAPRMFNPHNTNPCPQMFADKWIADAD